MGAERKLLCNSIIFSLFMAETFVCGIINSFINISNISVLVVATLLICSLLYNNLTIHCKRNDICIITVIFAIFVVSYFINRNYCIRYLQYFLVFGLTSFYFMRIQFDIKLVIDTLRRVFVIFLITYILFSRSRFLNASNYWSQQMGMAYCFYLIIVISVIELTCLHKTKLTFIPIINIVASAYFLFFDCGTRGAILSLLIFGALLALYNKKKNVFFLLAFIIIAVIIAYINVIRILCFLDGFLSSMNIGILSLNKTIWKLQQTGSILNGRDSIYGVAVNCIRSSPVFGLGIGGFERINYVNYGQSGYAHQFFLELMCEYGIIGTVFVSWIIIKSIIYIFKNRRINNCDESLKGFIFLVCSMPMLMVSNSYWLLPSYWIFFAWCIGRKTLMLEEIE